MSGLRKLLRDANRGAEVRMLMCRDFCDQLHELRNAADTYMTAVVCYNENPWDLANVRKYVDAKNRLHELLHPQPNNQIQRPR